MLVIAVTCSNIGGSRVFEAPRRLSGEGVRALAHAELGPSAAVTPKRVRRELY